MRREEGRAALIVPTSAAHNTAVGSRATVGLTRLPERGSDGQACLGSCGPTPKSFRLRVACSNPKGIVSEGILEEIKLVLTGDSNYVTLKSIER